jgi:hypothetical protein
MNNTIGDEDSIMGLMRKIAVIPPVLLCLASGNVSADESPCPRVSELTEASVKCATDHALQTFQNNKEKYGDDYGKILGVDICNSDSEIPFLNLLTAHQDTTTDPNAIPTDKIESMIRDGIENATIELCSHKFRRQNSTGHSKCLGTIHAEQVEKYRRCIHDAFDLHPQNSKFDGLTRNFLTSLNRQYPPDTDDSPLRSSSSYGAAR